MPSNALPSSTLRLSSLQPGGTPSLLDLRPLLNTIRDPNINAALTLLQQALDNIQKTLRSASPSLKSISIGSADIEDLTVSGEFGPGAFQILNGPPNYDQIGWMGSQAAAASVNLTSIVAGLVTAAAPHELKPGDNVYIEQTTDISNTGYYVVATTPLATTFTVTGGITGGNSTGGSMTKQFQGAWLKAFAAGGTEFADAPLKVDVDGSLTITDATIIVTHTSGSTTSSIIIDPTQASITVQFIGTLGGRRVVLQDGTITLTALLPDGSVDLDNSYSSITTGLYTAIATLLTSTASSIVAGYVGFTDTSSFGPLIGLTAYRGSPLAAAAVQLADTLGGIVFDGYDGATTQSPAGYTAAMRAEAAETFTDSGSTDHHGTQIVFETTATGGGTVPVVAATILPGGGVDSTEFQVAGTKVVGARGAALTAAIPYGGGIVTTPYTAATATFINDLSNQVINLKTRLDQLEARLAAATGHGLIA